MGSWGRNCIHQEAGLLVALPFGTAGIRVGTTVGSPLGRLGMRFNKPFRPLPPVPLVLPVGAWPVAVSGPATAGTLESAACKAEPTCWAQPRAAVTTALASSASAWSWALVLAMMAA